MSAAAAARTRTRTDTRTRGKNVALHSVSGFFSSTMQTTTTTTTMPLHYRTTTTTSRQTRQEATRPAPRSISSWIEEGSFSRLHRFSVVANWLFFASGQPLVGVNLESALFTCLSSVDPVPCSTQSGATNVKSNSAFSVMASVHKFPSSKNRPSGSFLALVTVAAPGSFKG
jgi:hypothetical protein